MGLGDIFRAKSYKPKKLKKALWEPIYKYRGRQKILKGWRKK